MERKFIRSLLKNCDFIDRIGLSEPILTNMTERLEHTEGGGEADGTGSALPWDEAGWDHLLYSSTYRAVHRRCSQTLLKGSQRKDEQKAISCLANTTTLHMILHYTELIFLKIHKKGSFLYSAELLFLLLNWNTAQKGKEEIKNKKQNTSF